MYICVYETSTNNYNILAFLCCNLEKYDERIKLSYTDLLTLYIKNGIQISHKLRYKK